jgi:hypothetical protein
MTEIGMTDLAANDVPHSAEEVELRRVRVVCGCQTIAMWASDGFTMEELMHIRSTMVALSLMAAALPAYAGAPLERAVPTTRAFPSMTVIYEVAGVKDNGYARELGMATSFLCTNADIATRTVRIVLRNKDGGTVANVTVNVLPFRTLTASTHETRMFVEPVILYPGHAISQGSAFISATSANVICSAMIVNAESLSADGIALHMVRYNPAPGTEE